MENKRKTESNHRPYTNVFILLGVILLIGIASLLLSSSKLPIRSLLENNQKWTLFIYAKGRDDLPTTVIPNYESQRSCIEKGIQLMTLPENKGEGALFTCGLNCKIEYGVNVCSRVCYKDGNCRE